MFLTYPFADRRCYMGAAPPPDTTAFKPRLEEAQTHLKLSQPRKYKHLEDDTKGHVMKEERHMAVMHENRRLLVEIEKIRTRPSPRLPKYEAPTKVTLKSHIVDKRASVDLDNRNQKLVKHLKNAKFRSIFADMSKREEFLRQRRKNLCKFEYTLDQPRPPPPTFYEDLQTRAHPISPKPALEMGRKSAGSETSDNAETASIPPAKRPFLKKSANPHSSSSFHPPPSNHQPPPRLQ
eukprot:gnl/Hemi2/12740_TR4351_c0_g1_i1.p2 gnl/Hemi2/12740_TR4351_c0_g1~~gnl/Hemi2/12740_TR4351_c0_g1_i1.p2  ORF type:complete len:236 (-),score=47.39 gnl/Hemi2/12740_TR4351_c0_g1_i1:136-843(-)